MKLLEQNAPACRPEPSVSHWLGMTLCPFRRLFSARAFPFMLSFDHTVNYANPTRLSLNGESTLACSACSPYPGRGTI